MSEEGFCERSLIRNTAYKLYSRNPNRQRGDNQWMDYVQKRDRASSLISAAKMRYGEKHFGQDLPAKKLWSNLRREGIHNSSKQNISTDEINADELNQFFAEGHRQLGAATRQSAQDEPRHRTAVDHGAEAFNFRHTNADEVCRKLFEIRTNATGSDGIPISFVKLLCPFILPVLVHLYNAIIVAISNKEQCEVTETN